MFKGPVKYVLLSFLPSFVLCSFSSFLSLLSFCLGNLTDSREWLFLDRKLRTRIHQECFEFVKEQRIDCLVRGIWVNSTPPPHTLTTTEQRFKFVRLAANTRKSFVVVEVRTREGLDQEVRERKGVDWMMGVGASEKSEFFPLYLPLLCRDEKSRAESIFYTGGFSSRAVGYYEDHDLDSDERSFSACSGEAINGSCETSPSNSFEFCHGSVIVLRHVDVAPIIQYTSSCIRNSNYLDSFYNFLYNPPFRKHLSSSPNSLPTNDYSESGTPRFPLFPSPSPLDPRYSNS